MRPRPRFARRAIIAVVFALGVSACAPLHASSTPEDDSDAVTLIVVNHNQLNVVAYNVAQGHRERIGEVVAVSSATFTLHLRRITASELQLYADPIGSTSSTTSERLHLSAGDTVTWTLEVGTNDGTAERRNDGTAELPREVTQQHGN